jgi:hypothetical protein
VVKCQFGSSKITRTEDTNEIISLADDLKAAGTDSLKKCATMLGVRLYLYFTPRISRKSGRNGPEQLDGLARNTHMTHNDGSKFMEEYSKTGEKRGPFAGLGFQLIDKSTFFGGGNDDLPQNSLKARAPRNSLIINAEVISHNHFPPTRPEKRISPPISRHRTRVTGLQ